LKEKYFNSNNLKQMGQDLLDYCPQSLRHNGIVPDWNNSALLILDMQRYFLSQSSHAYIASSPAIVPAVVNLAKLYIERDLTVICTRHINKVGYKGMMKKWWNQVITEPDEMSKLTPKIFELSTTVIVKSEYDAFHETELPDILSQLGIKDLIVTGVMTHLCVETTIRSAFVRGFQPFLPVDGTATYNKAHHSASLLNLSHGFAVMTSMDRLIGSITEAIND